MKQLVCPVSDERTDEQVTRLSAFFVVLLTITGLYFYSGYLFVFLMVDFYIRGFIKTRFSPVNFLSSNMANSLNLSQKYIDKAPKIFAARLGFLITAAISVFLFLGLKNVALAIGFTLVFFATLEFALAICMGCILYTYLILPFYRK